MKVDRLSLFIIDRAALLRGIRITASATVPLIVGQQLGQPSFALIVALGGLFVAVSDTDGFFRVQLLSLITTTIGICTAAFIGTVAGNIPLFAILLALVTSFVIGFAGVFGNTVSRASFPVLVTLLVMLGRSDNVSSALMRSGGMAAGACWAIALSLLISSIQAPQPKENVVVTYYRSIQKFFKKAAEVVLVRQDEASEWEKVTQNEHSAVLEAHFALHTTSGSRLSPLSCGSAQDQYLLTLTLLADHLFDAAIVLLNDIEEVGTVTDDEHLWIRIRQALHALQSSLEECIQLIEDRQIAEQPQDTRQLQQAIDTLRQQVAAKQQETEKQLLVNHADPFQLQHIIQDFVQVQEILVEIINIERQPLTSSYGERYTALLRKFSQVSMVSITLRIKDNLSTHSPIFCHALRLSLATTLAVTLYELLHLSYGYWITVTVAVVLRPQYGATQQRVFQGVVATVAGGIIAALLIASVHNMLILYVLLIVTGIIAYSHFPNYFGRFYFFLTPFVLLLFGMSHPGTWQAAFIRIIDTFIGGALAYLVYILLWPRETRVYVSDLLADLILANRDYLEHVVTDILDQHVDIATLHQASEHVKCKYAALLSAYQQLQDEPKKLRGNLTYIGNIMSYNQYFYDKVTSLASELQHLVDRACITEFRSVVREVNNLLTTVAFTVRSEQQLLQPVQQNETIQHLQEELARLQPEQPTGSVNNQNNMYSLGRNVCQIAVYTYLKPLADTVINMYAALVAR